MHNINRLQLLIQYFNRLFLFVGEDKYFLVFMKYQEPQQESTHDRGLPGLPALHINNEPMFVELTRRTTACAEYRLGGRATTFR